MNKNCVINLRVSESLKNKFQALTNQENFTMSQVIECYMSNAIKNGISDDIKEQLRPKKNGILTLPQIKFDITEVLSSEAPQVQFASVFGSYARGEATPDSDVDILIHTDKDVDMFWVVGLQRKLEEKLGKKVDLYTDDTNTYFMNHIRRERIQLYERERIDT